MLKYLLAFAFAIPLGGHCQSYADSPFYKTITALPSTVRVGGYQHGTIKANGIVIDLSEWVPESSSDFDQIAGWSGDADVEGAKPGQVFHRYIQYDRLSPVVVFGYDLFVQPVEGTDQIRCTFSALTDFAGGRHRNKEIAPVALPTDLTPVVIHSGDLLAIKTLPLGPGRIAAVHYLRLTRTDLTPGSAQ